jgi:hypothetical protein
MSIVTPQIIAERIKTLEPLNISRGVIFHDPSSAQVSSPFPFVAVIPIDHRTFRARENLLGALANISGGHRVSDLMIYTGGTNEGYLGFSGMCEVDFRELLIAYGTGFAQLSIHHLSTGPMLNARYVSCVTLRDCVEAVSARIEGREQKPARTVCYDLL